MNGLTQQSLFNKRVRKYKEETNTFEEYNSLNKKPLEGVNNILDDTAEWISNLDDIVEITQAEEEKENRALKGGEIVEETSETTSAYYIFIIWVTERRDKGLENLFEEVMLGKLP